MQWVDSSKRFFLECRRVWQITRKPTTQEFRATVKVTGIGIVLIGLIGFLIHLLWQLLLA